MSGKGFTGALLIGGLTAAIMGVAWYVIGGFPGDHDRYGKVPLGAVNKGALPKDVGKAVGGDIQAGFEAISEQVQRDARAERSRVELPGGEVRINYDGGSTGNGSSESAREAPESLRVTVRRAAGGPPLAVEDAGGYDSVVGDDGWASWKKIEAPEAGAYIVDTRVDLGNGGDITFGERFWNPLGSRLLGAFLPAIVIGLLILGVSGVLTSIRR